MAEKDATARLRRAVKENNLLQVKRLIKRTDMRNPDPLNKRYTSLAWAAVLGHEETFEFLLASGHDDHEYSKDSDNNTILLLLADAKPPFTSPYGTTQSEQEFLSATLRMARLYYDRYPDILDWANMEGKTALHVAALKGKEELVRMFCDFGADVDLADNEGNAPLHYASAWGHIPVVQLLIERGCQYSARNNEGFTPSDYAYSISTRDTLQDTARTQFELNKKARRNVFAQAAARGTEWGATPDPILGPPPRAYFSNGSRMRSGSGTSRTTNTSDSGDMLDGYSSRSHLSPVSSLSPPRRPNPLPSGSYSPAQPSASSSGSASFSTASPSAQSHLVPPTLSSSTNPASALSPIATRMLERDADAMEKYKLRQRSGSGTTASTDNQSANGSAPTPEDRKQPLITVGSVAPRRRLRPSASAAQLRTTPQPPAISPNPSISQQEMARHRSGTSPATMPASPSTQESMSLATPTQSSSRPQLRRREEGETGGYTGPPSQYADFPAPPVSDDPIERTRTVTPTTATGPAPSYSRRLPFNLLSSHRSNSDATAAGHRRNASVNAVIR
ncbi:ankyrin [Daedalea quercina L-15889]|uniref:Ankyrin n=1 Tax=Daedalea quercina L-15889 TaxID=1314783 RepID=A0A165U2G9_9APHY|nr:ankyrin [Daedalea quercina L-15889]